MKESIIRRSVTIIFFILMFYMSTVVVMGKEIEIEEGLKYKEITITEGLDFKIRLAGKGWYLNRYGRENLSFKYRFLEPEHTCFIIHPLRKGISYLLFTYLNKDVYIRVKIEETTPENNKGETGEKVNDDITSLENIAHDTGLEKPEPSGEVKVDDIESYKKDEDLVKEKGEIYYVNKKSEVVPVPVKKEDDSYVRGIGLFKKGMYKEALKSLLDYVSNCEKCRYRDDANIKLAEAHINLDNETEALSYLGEVIRSGSDKFAKEAYVKKADIDYRAKRYKDAVDSYKNALGYDRGDSDLLEKIGDIYYLLNNYTDALKIYEELIERGYTGDEVLFRIASICDSPGKVRNLEKAYKYYKIIVENYSISKHFTYAKERVQFMEKNFFNYR